MFKYVSKASVLHILLLKRRFSPNRRKENRFRFISAGLFNANLSKRVFG
jgi:hypothetical protein